MRNWYLIALTGWAMVILATIAALVLLPRSTDPATRGLDHVWIVLAGYVPALVLALLAAFGARGRTGVRALVSHRLPLVMGLLLLLPFAFNLINRLIYW